MDGVGGGESSESFECAGSGVAGFVGGAEVGVGVVVGVVEVPGCAGGDESWALGVLGVSAAGDVAGVDEGCPLCAGAAVVLSVGAHRGWSRRLASGSLRIGRRR